MVILRLSEKIYLLAVWMVDMVAILIDDMVMVDMKQMEMVAMKQMGTAKALVDVWIKAIWRVAIWMVVMRMAHMWIVAMRIAAIVTAVVMEAAEIVETLMCTVTAGISAKMCLALIIMSVFMGWGVEK